MGSSNNACPTKSVKGGCISLPACSDDLSVSYKTLGLPAFLPSFPGYSLSSNMSDSSPPRRRPEILITKAKEQDLSAMIALNINAFEPDILTRFLYGHTYAEAVQKQTESLAKSLGARFRTPTNRCLIHKAVALDGEREGEIVGWSLVRVCWFFCLWCLGRVLVLKFGSGKMAPGAHLNGSNPSKAAWMPPPSHRSTATPSGRTGVSSLVPNRTLVRETRPSVDLFTLMQVLMLNVT